MASAPSKTTTTKTVNNKTGVTTSTSTTKSGNSTTTTKTTTIGKAPTTSSSSSVSTPASAPAAALAGTWITGPNDTGWAMCGPVAIANHLLDATGTEAPNGAIEALYRAGGGIGDSGAPLEFFLQAAASDGLAGCRLARYSLVSELTGPGVLLLAIPGVGGLHAAAVTRDGQAVLWGAEFPLGDLDARVLNAWSLAWHGTETR